jgi:hypothetical protein
MFKTKAEKTEPKKPEWSHGRVFDNLAVRVALENLEHAEGLQAEHEQKIRAAMTAAGQTDHNAQLDQAALQLLDGVEPDEKTAPNFQELRRVAGLLERGVQIRRRELETAIAPAVKEIAERAVSDDRRLVSDVLQTAKAFITACDALATFRNGFRAAASVGQHTQDFAVAPMRDVTMNPDAVRALRSAVDQAEPFVSMYLDGKTLVQA